MRRPLPARHTIALSSGLACLLLGGSLALSVPSSSATGTDPLPPAATQDTCGRLPSTPTPLGTDLVGLSWEPMLAALPALVSPSVEEQAYLVAIDEVHRHIRIDGSRLGMAMIMYSICEIDGAMLGSRLVAVRTDLDQAATVLASLAVPEPLEALDHNYQQVVRLYQQGLAEMDRTTQDGNTQHLRDALPFTRTASDELAELESLVWAAPTPDLGQPGNPGGVASSTE